MNAGDAWHACVRSPICLGIMHNTDHGDVAYINGGTHAYYEHKSIMIMYTILVTNDVC